MILFEDETIVTETPPLRAAWGRCGEPVEVPITGNRAKGVLYGVLNARSGAMSLHRAKEWNQEEFQLVLRQLRRKWRGWLIVLFIDRGSPHRARRSQQLARALGIQLRWLPVACPELNPVDHLWRHVKEDVLANEPLPEVEASMQRACEYLESLSPQERLQKAGVLSGHFWLGDVLELENVKKLRSSKGKR